MAATFYFVPVIPLLFAVLIRSWPLNCPGSNDEQTSRWLFELNSITSSFGAGLEAIYRSTRPNRLVAILDLPSKTMSSKLFFSLLLLSGDIHLNPGPVKYPCGICSKPVKINQRGIQCDFCDKWHHIRCMNMNTVSPTKLWKTRPVCGCATFLG